jgi:hypothetical protein
VIPKSTRGEMAGRSPNSVHWEVSAASQMGDWMGKKSGCKDRNEGVWWAAEAAESLVDYHSLFVFRLT